MNNKSICANLIGIPYKKNGRDDKGLDCYGLIILLANRLHKYLPEQKTPEGFKLRREMFEKISSKYTEEIDKPEAWSVVVFRKGVRNRLHIGMVLEDAKRFIHVGPDSVETIRLDSRAWQRRILGFYRLKDKNE